MARRPPLSSAGENFLFHYVIDQTQEYTNTLNSAIKRLKLSHLCYDLEISEKSLNMNEPGKSPGKPPSGFLSLVFIFVRERGVT